MDNSYFITEENMSMLKRAKEANSIMVCDFGLSCIISFLNIEEEERLGKLLIILIRFLFLVSNVV